MKDTSPSRSAAARSRVGRLLAGLTLRDLILCCLPIGLMLAVVIWLGRS